MASLAHRLAFRRPEPRSVPRGYVKLFGWLDPFLARKVALSVQQECYERFWSARTVTAHLTFLGAQEGFGLTKGFQLLGAGRWLITRRWRRTA